MFIYCPNCEKTVKEEVRVLGEKEYKITEITCSECKEIVLYTKRLAGKVLDKG